MPVVAPELSVLRALCQGVFDVEKLPATVSTPRNAALFTAFKADSVLVYVTQTKLADFRYGKAKVQWIIGQSLKTKL